MGGNPRVLLALPHYRGPNHAIFTGIACLAASLRAAGADVAVFDEDVAAGVEQEGGPSAHELLESVLRAEEPDVVGVHVNTPNYASALALIRSIRGMTGAPIVAGGPHATAAAAAMLSMHPEVDYVLAGEADHSFPLLVEGIVRRAEPDVVPGLYRRSSDGIDKVARGALLDIDSLPAPDRAALLLPRHPTMAAHARGFYNRNFYRHLPGFTGRDVTPAYVSRGCPCLCHFCAASPLWADPVSGRPVRRVRSVERVMSEMEEVKGLGYNAVFFDEPTFPIRSASGWAQEFCAALAGSDLGLHWGAPTRLDEIDPSVAPMLADAGCTYLYVGIESPHERLAEGMGKQVRAADVPEVFRRLEDSGIRCDASLLFGAPGETPETISRTLEWLDRSFPRGNAFFSMAAVWPGTRWADDFRLSPECWEPEFDKRSLERKGLYWYGEEQTSIEKFFSNSTGTYHLLRPEAALEIKERIIESGFRARFSQYARGACLETVAR